jgi:hypothetical protein
MAGKTADRRGIQLDRFFLPDAIKELLVAEFKRSDEEKTHLALIKFFNPQGAGTWWVSEFDAENEEFFGLCEIQEKDLGYISFAELRTYRGPFTLGIERDYYFTPKLLSELEED